MGKISKGKTKVLDQFETRNDEWTYGQFESSIIENLRGNLVNHQDAKMAIIEAHRNGSWPNTVKRYILSNYTSFGNVPSELNDILDDVLLNLSEDEKKYWGVV